MAYTFTPSSQGSGGENQQDQGSRSSSQYLVSLRSVRDIAKAQNNSNKTVVNNWKGTGVLYPTTGLQYRYGRALRPP